MSIFDKAKEALNSEDIEEKSDAILIRSQTSPRTSLVKTRPNRSTRSVTPSTTRSANNPQSFANAAEAGKAPIM